MSVRELNWGHDDLKKKYITDRKTAVEYIAVDKMTPEAAAKKRVEANRSTVDAWIR